MNKGSDKKALLQELSAGYSGRTTSVRYKITNELFEGIDFTHRDLAFSDFRKCKFISCIFSQVILRNVIFDSAVFDTCTFSQSDLSCADMRRVSCVKTSFESCDMHHLDARDSCFIKGVFRDTVLEEANLDEVVIRDCIIDRCNAHGVSMRVAQIENSSWKDAILSAALLNRAMWKGGCLEECNLSFAVAQEVTMRKCLLKRNTYRGADFTGVKGMSPEMASSILSYGGVIERSGLQKLWKIKHGKWVIIFVFLSTLFGITEVMYDVRLETTDVVLQRIAEAIDKGRLGDAKWLLSIVNRRKLFVYQEARFNKIKGDFFKKIGNKKLAEKAYGEAENLSSTDYSLDARVQIAILYQEEKQYEEAIRELKLLLSVIPVWDTNRKVWIRLMLGETYMGWGKYDNAMRVLQEVIEDQGARPEQIVEARIKIAELNDHIENREEALQIFEGLLSAGLGNKDQRGVILLKEGNLYKALGNRGKAKEKYEQAKAWSNQWHGLAARAALAEMYREYKKFEDSIREYEELLRVNRRGYVVQNVNARYGMGQTYVEWGKYSEAISVYKSIERLGDASPEQITDCRERIVNLKKMV